jgi:hypothetical protein
MFIGGADVPKTKMNPQPPIPRQPRRPAAWFNHLLHLMAAPRSCGKRRVSLLPSLSVEIIVALLKAGADVSAAEYPSGDDRVDEVLERYGAGR